jgi:hypothetical protein
VTKLPAHRPAKLPAHRPSRRDKIVDAEFDELHVRRAFAYLGEARGYAATPQRLGSATLAVRTLVDLTIALHPMRVAGGPLSGCSPHALRAAVKALSTRLVRFV